MPKSSIKRSEMAEGRRCVKHKWVMEIKRSGRFRARLVACGYSQVAGVDFTDIHSPVKNDSTLKMLIVVLMILRYAFCLIDIETAFLTGELEEEIYMECPETIGDEETECVKLEKTIYGLVQSS